MFGAWVAPRCLLLEQGVGDDELMLRRELQKREPVVIAVVNSLSAKDSFPQFKVYQVGKQFPS